MIQIPKHKINILAYYPDMQGDSTPISNQEAMRKAIGEVFWKEFGFSIQWGSANNYMVSYKEYQGFCDIYNISFRVSEQFLKKQRLLQFGRPKQDKILTLIFYEEDRLYFGYVYQLCRSEQYQTFSTGSTAVSQPPQYNITETRMLENNQPPTPVKQIPAKVLQTNKTCKICVDEMKEAQSIKLECGHQTHKDCLAFYLNEVAKVQRSFKALKCPYDGCTKVVSIEILKKVLPSKLFQYICTWEAESSGAIYCPQRNCGMPIQGNTNIIRCFKCNSNICCKCKEVVVQDHQCKQNIQEMIEMIQSDPAYLAVCCPGCSSIFSKGKENQGCNHVQCYTCKMELCAVCSVNRYQTIAHGNHYHRQGCDYYKAFKMEYDPAECEYCRKSGKPCEFPLSLKDYFDGLREL